MGHISSVRTALWTILLLFFVTSTQAQLWNQLGADIDGEVNGGFSGSSVSLSADGSRLAIGAIQNDGNGVLAGHVRLHHWNGSAWAQLGADIDGEAPGDRSGQSVSLSADGSRVAIGAWLNDGNGFDAGHVRLYGWNGNAWVQVGADIDGEAAGDNSGTSVSLSADGSRVAIGAAYNDGNGADAGHVRIYDWSGSAWVQTGADIDGEAAGDVSGNSVSLSADGSRVAVGAGYNNGNGADAGHVRLYDWNGSAWVQLGTDIDGEAAGDLSGWSVSLSADGSRVAIGAGNNAGNGSYAGQVRIYDWSGSAWVQTGDDIDGEAAGDHSGNSVSLSADGSRVAIGAWGNDGNGPNAGQVRLYDWNGSAWLQLGADIDGEAPGDRSGHSVSLAADGSRVAIGAPSNDGNGASDGQVRVYWKPKGIWGLVWFDYDQDCTVNGNETTGLGGINLLIQPGDIVVQTLFNGSWSLDSLPEGNYTITIDTTSLNLTLTCPATQAFTITQPTAFMQAPTFGLVSAYPCAQPAVSISAPFLRRCFPNQQVFVSACNELSATGALSNAFVDIELDPLFTVNSGTLPFTALGNNRFRVVAGTINPDQCVNFRLSTTLSCAAVLDQTLCMNAELLPVDSCIFAPPPPPPPGPCTLPWDKSSIKVNGTCTGDSVKFTVTNTGSPVNGNMLCQSEVRVYMDEVLTYVYYIQLLGGESITYSFPAIGETYILQADQHPLHPGNSHPNAHVELCGSQANWTPGIPLRFAADDADPLVDIYCGQVTGSYDPNDKQGFPLGLGANFDILPGQQLQYLIRFQNTGNDTAFTVVIRDTLDMDVNIFTVQPGVASHPYTFRIYGPRVLEWRFDNILLPDSNVNEPASNGFVNFQVDQVPGLPLGTTITNTADIYFDYNDPIITNTTLHTVNIQQFTVPTAGLGVRFALEGPFVDGTGLMGDQLRQLGLVPLVEPYTGLGFAQLAGGGGESTTTALLSTTGNDAVVDWVRLELRDTTNNSVLVATRQALIQRDGDIIEADGGTTIKFGVPAGSYHLVVRHRNHLGAMTAQPIAVGPGASLVDLSSLSTAAFGVEARKVVDGQAVLWAGDVNVDGVLKYTGTDNDRDMILQQIGGIVPTNTVPGYHIEDANLDGVVKYTGTDNDRDRILQNIGGVVPTNSRLEQVP